MGTTQGFERKLIKRRDGQDHNTSLQPTLAARTAPRNVRNCNFLLLKNHTFSNSCDDFISPNVKEGYLKRHSSSLWFCPRFCPCPHFPHVLPQDFALALALYFAHLIEQNGGQGQGQNLGAKHEGNGGKGKNNWIWGQGQKEMTMWPVKIWDQGKRRWKYLKNRCYQFKGQSSTGQKSLQILEVGHITPTFTFLLSNKVKEKIVINAELHYVADTADVPV